MGNVERVERQLESKRRLLQKILRDIKELEETKRAFYFSMMNGKGVY